MLVDRRHFAWGLFTAVALGAAVWGWLLARPLAEASGSVPGLAIGAGALVSMLFAAVLGFRKRLVRSFGPFGIPRLGSLEWWTKGHVWLGTASLPLVLLHGNFRLGGPLTTALVGLTIAVVATGILGLVLQAMIPHQLTPREQGQTTYELADRRRTNLLQEAHALVKKASDDALVAAREAQAYYRMARATREKEVAAAPEGERLKLLAEQATREQAYERAVADAEGVRDRLTAARELVERAVESSRPTPKAATAAASRGAGGARSRASMGSKIMEPKGPAKPAADPGTLFSPAELVAFYVEVALPFLLAPRSRTSPLADQLESEMFFESVRHRTPEVLRPVLAELRAKCDAVRGKERARTLFNVLQGWQFAHVPLAVILVMLALVHGVMALWF